MLHRLEVKSRYYIDMGVYTHKQEEDLVLNWLRNYSALNEFRRHVGRPNVVNAKVYKLSIRGWRLIKEYDRERATKNNDRMGFIIR